MLSPAAAPLHADGGWGRGVRMEWGGRAWWDRWGRGVVSGLYSALIT